MKVICNTAGTGKTKQLIDIAKENNSIIVCEDPNRMYVKLHGYDVVGLTCISYYDYIDRVIDTSEGCVDNKNTYVIDDISKLLTFLSNDTIAFTCLIED